MVQTNKLARIVSEEDIQQISSGKCLIKTMAIRIPTKCNLNCRYCYGKMPLKQKPLLLEEIKGVIKQCAEIGARTVSITGEGEPLLYPMFRELLNYIKSVGMTPTIYSNCTLITPELAEFLYRQNAVVIGKQNTLSAKKQDKLSRSKNAYKSIMQGLDNLINAGFTETNPSRLGIHTVILKENLEEIPKMWRQWREKNILPQVQILVYPPKGKAEEYFDYYNKNSPSPQESRWLFEKLAKIDREEFGINWEPTSAYPIADSSCRVHCASVGITQEGNVQICNYTEDILGNIREKTLRSILSSDKVKKIRCVSQNLNYPGGGYGCRANAYNLTCNRFGPDPYYDEFLKASPKKKEVKIHATG